MKYILLALTAAIATANYEVTTEDGDIISLTPEQENDIYDYAFKQLDYNEDGFIEEAELVQFQSEYENEITHGECLEMISEADTDGDGRVSKAEYIAAAEASAAAALDDLEEDFEQELEIWLNVWLKHNHYDFDNVTL